MSNISRRKFLKGAGVAALAVAAAGVLAGCSADDVIDEVTTEKLNVVFVEEDGSKNYAGKTIEAKKGDRIASKDVADLVPENFMIAEETDNLPVDWDKKEVTVKVYAASVVTFKFMDVEDQSDIVGKAVEAKVATFKQKEGLASWEIENYAAIPEGYEIWTNPLTPNKKYKPEGGVLTVAVTKKAN